MNSLSAELFLKLYTSVGWEPRCIEQVKAALKNTIAAFTAYDNDKAVGMVRLIGDGENVIYVNIEQNISIGVTGTFKPRVFDRARFVEKNILPLIT